MTDDMAKRSFGNTSTYVEKTRIHHKRNIELQKHLHVRGEDLPPPVRETLFIETPPRTWRRRENLHRLGFTLRNTSTYVEKTDSSVGISADDEKHLHVRGEDSNILREKRQAAQLLVVSPVCGGSRPSCNPSISTTSFCVFPCDDTQYQGARFISEKIIKPLLFGQCFIRKRMIWFAKASLTPETKTFGRGSMNHNLSLPRTAGGSSEAMTTIMCRLPTSHQCRQ